MRRGVLQARDQMRSWSSVGRRGKGVKDGEGEGGGIVVVAEEGKLKGEIMKQLKFVVSDRAEWGCQKDHDGHGKKCEELNISQ